MCLVAFSLQRDASLPFVLISNRDEFFQRPSKPAHDWGNGVYGGKDLEKGGSWLLVSAKNKVSFVTNYRNLRLPKVEDPISRGQLVKDFVLGDFSPKEYLQKIESQKTRLEGCNLFLSDGVYSILYNPKAPNSLHLKDGIYAVSNGVLLEEWPKTKYIRNSLTTFLQTHKQELKEKSSKALEHSEELFRILKNRNIASESELPDTGIGKDREKYLSSAFIQLPGYGTRCSTIFWKRQDGSFFLKERSFQEDGSISGEVELKSGDL